MNNNVVLIGRINNDIEKIETEDKTIYKLMLNINRNFKNQNGEYEADFIPIELFIRVIAERVTFLSNNRNLVKQN